VGFARDLMAQAMTMPDTINKPNLSDQLAKTIAVIGLGRFTLD